MDNYKSLHLEGVTEANTIVIHVNSPTLTKKLQEFTPALLIATSAALNKWKI